MSKDRRQRNSPSPPQDGRATALGPAAGEVRQLIEKGNSKSAVELAKGLHKRFNNSESEELVVEAYRARIASLREHRMMAEADALVNMVRQRYPSSAAKLNTAAPVSVLRAVSLDDLVRPLNDPVLDREDRARIEEELRKRLDDPAALANSTALAAGHPLRMDAAAVDQAFRAAARGPVTEDQIALPSISRRSPLAPWKSLVRAIASFHQNDEISCQRHLDAIDPESPPARVAPVLRALLTGHSDAPLKPASRALFEQVRGGLETLRGALESLSRTFDSGGKGKAISEIRNAVRACRSAAPDVLERLKQHIAVQAFQTDLDGARVDGAMEGSCLKNASFWLLFARSMEGPQGTGNLEALSLWEQFRVHAIHEDWFPANGAEMAGLYLHMAGLLEGFSPEELQHLRHEFKSFPGYEAFYDDQPREIRMALSRHDPTNKYYLYPEQLFERACALDPRPEAFMRWMMWAQQNGKGDKTWKAVDKVAEAWRRALPSDSRPLLSLMLTAENRNAFKKALGFVEEAERLDPLNPDVRRARLKLLIGNAIRHVKERKPHLAERELAVLDTLPQAQEGSRPVVITALRWACSRVNHDAAASGRHVAAGAALVGSEATSIFVFGCIAYLCDLDYDAFAALPDRLPVGRQELLATAIAHGCAIGADVGLTFPIHDDFEKGVLRDLDQHGAKLDVPLLRALANAAESRNQRELVYAVSVAGLLRGGPSEARFLFIRAKALAPWDKRRNECIAAASELARRNRDMELVNEAVELRREGGSFFFEMLAGRDDRESLGEHELNKILKRERAATKYVKAAAPGVPPWMRGFEQAVDFDDEDDDDEDEEDVFNDPQFNLFLEELAQAASVGKKKRKRSGRNGPF